MSIRRLQMRMNIFFITHWGIVSFIDCSNRFLCWLDLLYYFYNGLTTEQEKGRTKNVKDVFDGEE